MKKFLLLLVITTSTIYSKEDPRLNLLNLPKDVKIFLKQLGTIRVGNEMDYYPYDYNENGSPMGLSVETVELIASILGLKIEWVYGYSWPELASLMEDRKIDVLPCVISTPKREEHIIFSEPLFISNIGALVRKDTNSSKVDLKNRTVGIVKGYEGFNTTLNSYRNIKVRYVDSLYSGIDLVKRGEIDALLDDFLTLEYYERLDSTNRLTVRDITKDLPENSDNFLRVGVRSDWERLNYAINAALKWIYTEEWEAITGNNIDRILYDSITLRKDEVEILLNRESINLYILNSLAPISYIEDGEFKGIIRGYIDELSTLLGIEFRVVNRDNYSLSHGLESLTSGESDMVLGISTSEERIKRGLRFGTPFTELPIGIYRNKNGVYLNNIKSLKGESIYAIEGHSIIEWIQRDYPELEIIAVKNVKEGLQRVNEESDSFYIGDSLITNRAIAESHFNNLLFANYIPYRYKLSAAVYGNPTLLSLIDKGLGEIEVNRRNTIESFWIGQKVQRTIDPHLKVIITLVIVILLSTILFITIHFKVREKILEDNSNHDSLTGLYNRRLLEKIYDRELSRSLREKKYLIFMIFDLDNFKLYNDNYGHRQGDVVLKELSGVLRSCFRRGSDYIFRLGGEEFGVITTLDREEHSIFLAKKVLNSLEKRGIEHSSNKPYKVVTISCGICSNSIKREVSFKEIYDIADRELYVSKKDGRNALSMGVVATLE